MLGQLLDEWQALNAAITASLGLGEARPPAVNGDASG
jgi:hypothetical protein